jgi:hypothetical protein
MIYFYHRKTDGEEPCPQAGAGLFGFFGGANVGDHVIFAIEEYNRLRIGAFPADKSPLPRGAEVVTRVSDADLSMMLLWAKRQAKRGWSLGEMKAACERS